MNYSDAERMSTVLDSLGYSKTENEKEADLFIVISCSVRQSAINRIYGKVRDLKELKSKNQKLKTILTGCVLEKDKKKLSKVFDIMLTMEKIGTLPQLLTSLRGTCDEAISHEGDCRAPLAMTVKRDYLSITPHYESTFRAYVPISTGCDNYCSYCAVPYTRGREKSRPMNDIVKEVQSLVKDGYQEITILGQNVNSYGNDLHSSPVSSLVASQGPNPEEKLDSWPPTRNDNSFIDLLLDLDLIPGDHRIYFYSNHPKDMTDELIATQAKLKHFPHYLHLPLQSGNDEVLKKMNRHYTKTNYENLVQKIRTIMPNVTLTTDIIVGFPGETEQQFYDTVEVMKTAKYDMAFIAQYSPRPGTVSAKLPDDVSNEEKRRREDILQKILAETVLAHNQKLVGTTQKVLVDEKKGDKYFGRTEGYKVVEIAVNSQQSTINSTDSSSSEVEKFSTRSNNKTDLIGRFITVKIESATSWKLCGAIS